MIPTDGESYLVTIVLEESVYAQVQDLANKQNYSMPSMVRALTIQGLVLRHERTRLEQFVEHHEAIDALLDDWFGTPENPRKSKPYVPDLAVKYGITEKMVLEIVANHYRNPHLLAFGPGAGSGRYYLSRKRKVVS